MEKIMSYPKGPSPKGSLRMLRYERLRAAEDLGGQKVYWTEERQRSWWLHL
jgi:hypothetical protein